MFSKSLDSKKTYVNDDGDIVVDLADSIVDKNKGKSNIYTLFKATHRHDMRPDKVSLDLYGTTDYTEMILKYAMIENPFSLECDDLIFSMRMDSIYVPIKEEYDTSTGAFDAIKNLHKYIDKSKVPNAVGSESNEKKIGTTPEEPNISKTGKSGVTIKDGKLYFGAIDEKLKSVDSSIVDCATDGTTIGDFLTSVLRNNNG